MDTLAEIIERVIGVGIIFIILVCLFVVCYIAYLLNFYLFCVISSCLLIMAIPIIYLLILIRKDIKGREIIKGQMEQDRKNQS
jgi:hypothetical protein